MLNLVQSIFHNKYSIRCILVLVCSLISFSSWADCPPNVRSCKPVKSKIIRTKKKVKTNQKTRVLGAKSKISNGVLYVTNQKITNSSADKLVSNNDSSAVVLVEGGSDIRKIVISGLRVDARNIRNYSNKDQALLVVDAPKNVDVEYKDSTLTSNNVHLHSVRYGNRSRVGGANINADKGGSNVNIKRVKAKLMSGEFLSEVDN